MAEQFSNFNAPTFTQGCGVPSNLPGVAVYNPEVTCPGAGFGASTFASPATALKVGLTTPIATFTFSSSAAARHLLIGDFPARCVTRIEDELGVSVVNICDDGVATSKNSQAENFCCWLDSGQIGIVGLILKSADQPSEISATQVLFDPCNPCFTSDTDFVCSNGCNDNSNFILTNAVVGGNAGLIIDLPAGISAKLDVCSCAPEVNSFATCPTSMPAVAQIAAAPACAPVGYPAQNGFGRGY